MKQLIELKKRELEDARKLKFEVEKQLELKAKELEALKKIARILEEVPSLKESIYLKAPKEVVK